MIEILSKTEISGKQLIDTIGALRSSMNSWEKSDTYIDDFDKNALLEPTFDDIGPKDRALMKNLIKGGSEERKFLRTMTVHIKMTAPLYFWKEFDTYKVGSTRNSCSTMHTIADHEFTADDFSHDKLIDDYSKDQLKLTIKALNWYRELYLNEKNRLNKKDYWWQMIQLLPSSYNQTSYVHLNYENLASMYRQRKNHKLDEWRKLCERIKNFNYAQLIVDEKEIEKGVPNDF